MPSATEQSIKRFEAAVSSLEAALQRRRQGPAADMSAEVHVLTQDRARLAEHLDRSQARAAKLDNVNRDVSRRLAAAVETIRAVLQADDEGR